MGEVGGERVGDCLVSVFLMHRVAGGRKRKSGFADVLWCRFVNPPTLQSVKGLPHFHVLARRKEGY